MLINLTNHPSSHWEKEQLEAATTSYGAVVDMPFPTVPPTADTSDVEKLAEEYVEKMVEQAKENDVTVHVMGEMTFTYAIVAKLQKLGIKCIASTTERNAIEDKNGTKTSVFKFARFRAYIQQTTNEI